MKIIGARFARNVDEMRLLNGFQTLWAAKIFLYFCKGSLDKRLQMYHQTKQTRHDNGYIS